MANEVKDCCNDILINSCNKPVTRNILSQIINGMTGPNGMVYTIPRDFPEYPTYAEIVALGFNAVEGADENHFNDVDGLAIASKYASTPNELVRVCDITGYSTSMSSFSVSTSYGQRCTIPVPEDEDCQCEEGKFYIYQEKVYVGCDVSGTTSVGIPYVEVQKQTDCHRARTDGVKTVEVYISKYKTEGDTPEGEDPETWEKLISENAEEGWAIYQTGVCRCDEEVIITYGEPDMIPCNIVGTYTVEVPYSSETLNSDCEWVHDEGVEMIEINGLTRNMEKFAKIVFDEMWGDQRIRVYQNGGCPEPCDCKSIDWGEASNDDFQIIWEPDTCMEKKFKVEYACGKLSVDGVRDEFQVRIVDLGDNTHEVIVKPSCDVTEAIKCDLVLKFEYGSNLDYDGSDLEEIPYGICTKGVKLVKYKSSAPEGCTYEYRVVQERTNVSYNATADTKITEACSASTRFAVAIYRKCQNSTMWEDITNIVWDQFNKGGDDSIYDYRINLSECDGIIYDGAVARTKGEIILNHGFNDDSTEDITCTAGFLFMVNEREVARFDMTVIQEHSEKPCNDSCPEGYEYKIITMGGDVNKPMDYNATDHEVDACDTESLFAISIYRRCISMGVWVNITEEVFSSIQNDGEGSRYGYKITTDSDFITGGKPDYDNPGYIYVYFKKNDGTNDSRVDSAAFEFYADGSTDPVAVYIMAINQYAQMALCPSDCTCNRVIYRNPSNVSSGPTYYVEPIRVRAEGGINQHFATVRFVDSMAEELSCITLEVREDTSMSCNKSRWWNMYINAIGYEYMGNGEFYLYGDFPDLTEYSIGTDDCLRSDGDDQWLESIDILEVNCNGEPMDSYDLIVEQTYKNECSNLRCIDVTFNVTAIPDYVLPSIAFDDVCIIRYTADTCVKIESVKVNNTNASLTNLRVDEENKCIKADLGQLCFAPLTADTISIVEITYSVNGNVCGTRSVSVRRRPANGDPSVCCGAIGCEDIPPIEVISMVEIDPTATGWIKIGDIYNPNNHYVIGNCLNYDVAIIEGDARVVDGLRVGTGTGTEDWRNGYEYGGIFMNLTSPATSTRSWTIKVTPKLRYNGNATCPSKVTTFTVSQSVCQDFEYKIVTFGKNPYDFDDPLVTSGRCEVETCSGTAEFEITIYRRCIDDEEIVWEDITSQVWSDTTEQKYKLECHSQHDVFTLEKGDEPGVMRVIGSKNETKEAKEDEGNIVIYANGIPEKGYPVAIHQDAGPCSSCSNYTYQIVCPEYDNSVGQVTLNFDPCETTKEISVKIMRKCLAPFQDEDWEDITEEVWDGKSNYRWLEPSLIGSNWKHKLGSETGIITVNGTCNQTDKEYTTNIKLTLRYGLSQLVNNTLATFNIEVKQGGGPCTTDPYCGCDSTKADIKNSFVTDPVAGSSLSWDWNDTNYKDITVNANCGRFEVAFVTPSYTFELLPPTTGISNNDAMFSVKPISVNESHEYANNASVKVSWFVGEGGTASMTKTINLVQNPNPCSVTYNMPSELEWCCGNAVETQIGTYENKCGGTVSAYTLSTDWLRCKAEGGKIYAWTRYPEQNIDNDPNFKGAVFLAYKPEGASDFSNIKDPNTGDVRTSIHVLPCNGECNCKYDEVTVSPEGLTWNCGDMSPKTLAVTAKCGYISVESINSNFDYEISEKSGDAWTVKVTPKKLIDSDGAIMELVHYKNNGEENKYTLVTLDFYMPVTNIDMPEIVEWCCGNDVKTQIGTYENKCGGTVRAYTTSTAWLNCEAENGIVYAWTMNPEQNTDNKPDFHGWIFLEYDGKKIEGPNIPSQNEGSHTKIEILPCNAPCTCTVNSVTWGVDNLTWNCGDMSEKSFEVSAKCGSLTASAESTYFDVTVDEKSGDKWKVKVRPKQYLPNIDLVLTLRFTTDLGTSTSKQIPLTFNKSPEISVDKSGLNGCNGGTVKFTIN